MRLRRSEMHTLAGAYAMDAVSSKDRARFERHLARCQSCAQELRELREATASLAVAVSAQPPGRLVARTIELAAMTPQQPDAQLRLELPDLSTQRRLRDVQPLGRPGEVQLVGHRQEIPQQPIIGVHLPSVRRIHGRRL